MPEWPGRRYRAPYVSARPGLGWRGFPMTARESGEYRALRATIRARGTARVWVFVVGLSAWAALMVATTAVSGVPMVALVPLVVLAGTFEAVFALHIGVERIGRYIQVFY